MDESDVKRLGEILAVQAEIEGMKAENKRREVLGEGMAYTLGDFNCKAEELRAIASKHRDQF